MRGIDMDVVKLGPRFQQIFETYWRLDPADGADWTVGTGPRYLSVWAICGTVYEAEMLTMVAEYELKTSGNLDALARAMQKGFHEGVDSQQGYMMIDPSRFGPGVPGEVFVRGHRQDVTSRTFTIMRQQPQPLSCEFGDAIRRIA